MSAQRNAATPIVSVVNNQPVTTSKNVAEAFGKRHAHVLDAIKNISVPEGFSREPIFRLTLEKTPMPNSAFRDDPMYEMTRDGFIFLVMGFTGAKAERVKWAYIEAFNKMEAALRSKALPPPSSQQLAFTLAPDEKRCCRCKQMKPYGEFNRNTTSKDGYGYRCAECNKALLREYRDRNKTMNKLRAGGTERDDELARFVHTITVTDPDHYDGPDNARKALCELITVAQQMTHVHEICSYMSFLSTLNAVPEKIGTRIVAAARDTKIIRNNVFRILERVAGSTQQAIKYPEQITQGEEKK